MNPLFKMSNVGAGANHNTNNLGHPHSSIHSQGTNSNNPGGHHMPGQLNNALGQGIGGNAIGHGSNIPPRSQQSGSIFSASNQSSSV